MRKIGACWKRKSKDGKQYLSGQIDLITSKLNIVLFKNDKKTNPKQPDYNIVLSEERKNLPQVTTEKIDDLE